MKFIDWIETLQEPHKTRARNVHINNTTSDIKPDGSYSLINLFYKATCFFDENGEIDRSIKGKFIRLMDFEDEASMVMEVAEYELPNNKGFMTSINSGEGYFTVYKSDSKPTVINHDYQPDYWKELKEQNESDIDDMYMRHGGDGETCFGVGYY